MVVAGQAMPGLQVDWNIQGEEFRVQQCYFANEHFNYTIAVHAPVDQFADLAGTLASIRDTFEFVDISGEARLAARLRHLAAFCGSEVNWAGTWDEASRQARAEDKHVLVMIRSQSGFDIPDAFMTVTLMNEDIIDMVNQHCVVFRYEKGMQAPFNSYDKYGIGPASFGNTVLLVEPDGKVIGDAFSSQADTFQDFLFTTWKDRMGRIDPPDDLESPFDKARWLSRRGQLDAALDVLADPQSIEEHRLRASLFRRLRQVEQADAELLRALEKTDDDALRAGIELDRHVLHLISGMTPATELRDQFEKLVRFFPGHKRFAEMRYWAGICQFAIGDREMAEGHWKGLINTLDDDNRWAWRSAAVLQSAAFRMSMPPEFGLPADEVIEAFRSVPFEPLDATRFAQAERDAIDYLLRHQREDGSWISPPDALKTTSYATSPFTIAITSICGRSLLPYHAEGDIAVRIEKTLAFLVEAHAAAKAQPERKFYMDYSPWADAYLLRFLASVASELPQHRDKLESLVADKISALQDKQKPGGGWSYYITHNLEDAGQPTNHSASFMTAAIVIALLETREAGFEVPESLTDDALDCLDRMRNDNRTWTYFLWHEREGTGRDTGVEGAAGRGPLCSHALAMAGRGSADEVALCLDLFVEHGHLYSRERGKSLMHAAPGGQGSHYLMFDYAWAAAAAASLPEAQRKKYREPLLNMILNSRSAEGSYLDNPINGWHYGTGMALEAFQLLQ